MTDCKRVLQNIFEYLDKELDKTNAEEVEKHIELCRKCYDHFEFEQALRDRIREIAGKKELSPEFKKRIQNILHEFDQ